MGAWMEQVAVEKSEGEKAGVTAGQVGVTDSKKTSQGTTT